MVYSPSLTVLWVKYFVASGLVTPFLMAMAFTLVLPLITGAARVSSSVVSPPACWLPVLDCPALELPPEAELPLLASVVLAKQHFAAFTLRTDG